MRGSDARTGSLFSFVDLEDRVPKRHPLRTIRQIVNDALASLDADFACLLVRRSPLDRAGEAPAHLAVAGVLLGALGASADGAARLQSHVPLVRGARRCGPETAARPSRPVLSEAHASTARH